MQPPPRSEWLCLWMTELPLQHPRQILAPRTARRSAWVAQEAEASRRLIEAHSCRGTSFGVTSCEPSIRPAQSLFPKFDYSRRKFAPSNSGASAGFRPHLKQGVIFAEQVALRNLVRFRTRPSLGCHFQQLDERSDILVMGVHDKPLRNVGDLTHNNTGCRCVGHHEKTH